VRREVFEVARIVLGFIVALPVFYFGLWCMAVVGAWVNGI
jgi:hypothetical protein